MTKTVVLLIKLLIITSADLGIVCYGIRKVNHNCKLSSTDLDSNFAALTGPNKNKSVNNYDVRSRSGCDIDNVSTVYP